MFFLNNYGKKYSVMKEFSTLVMVLLTCAKKCTCRVPIVVVFVAEYKISLKCFPHLHKIVQRHPSKTEF